MLFNSLQYIIFFPLVYLSYWLVFNKNLKLQNLFLLVLSYFFYSRWDYRFLFLLVFSTLLDFYSGIKIEKSKTSFDKKFWFYSSILINLGFLCLFKYYNFFIDSLSILLLDFGIKTNPYFLSLILPVGISFYTFHGLSYIIDIYYGRIKSENNIVNYSLFVSFFPLLVAGPIERATHLLPQVKKKRIFSSVLVVDGLKQILWGMFKKVAIADNCGEYANHVFNNSNDYSGSTLFLGAIFFSFQIYGDFSGYSDIAIGSARMLGFDLLKNFSYPYFSRNIAEFWRRWHISLTTWFRDYIYIPLGGSKVSLFYKIRNTFIIFLISGFWHGANWTFIFWGFLNALYFLPSLIFGQNRNYLETVSAGRTFPSLKELFQIGGTFILTTIAWIFFRSNNLDQAFRFINKMFTFDLFIIPYFPGIGLSISTIILVVFFIFIEWLGREHEYAIKHLMYKYNRIIRWLFYGFLLYLILLFNTSLKEFIYFQF